MTVPEVPPLLFSNEEKEAPFGVKPGDKKVDGGKDSSAVGSTHLVEESEKVDFFFLHLYSEVFVSHVL